MHHSFAQPNVVDLTEEPSDVDSEMQQAIQASLLDLCCPGGDVEVPAELQKQQVKELAYYQDRQMQAQQAPQASIPAAPKAPGQHLQSECHDYRSSDLPKHLQQIGQDTADLRREEGSEASTTSAEPSLSPQEPSGKSVDKAEPSMMQTPTAAEARLPAIGLINPGHHNEAHVATWPTAAADLMVLAPQTTPASPASSAIAGSFGNKRRKLEVPDAPFNLHKTSVTRVPNPFQPQSAQLPAWQHHKSSSTPDTANKADLQSDAESDPCAAEAAVPQHRVVHSSFLLGAASSDHSLEQQVPTAVPDLLASPEQLNTEAGDSADAECGSVSGRDSPVNHGASSDSMPFKLVDYKCKGFKGFSPLLPAAPEQESKLDHLKKGNWVWWKPDSTWLLARVEERYWRLFGLVHDYEISVLSEDGSFAMSNVPPDEICIHFFPGSRVNIKGQPPKQGEVLPIEDRQMFNGVYTVRLDEGRKTKVAHCDMQLVLNDAEASSWVRSGPCLSGTVNEMALHPNVAQQQQHQQQQQGQAYLGNGVAALHEAPAISSRGLQDCMPAASLAVPTSPAELSGNAMKVSKPLAASADCTHNQEEEQLVPQLRRTKRSVAQKRLVPSNIASGDDPGRSVQRKLNHSSFPSLQAASTREAQKPALAGLAPPASKSEVPTSAAQKLHTSDLEAWEHDSDDDLYVDLSGSNIKPQLGRMQELSAMHVSPMSQPAGTSDLASSTPNQAKGDVSLLQARRKAGKAGAKAYTKLRAADDPFVALGLRAEDFLS